MTTIAPESTSGTALPPAGSGPRARAGRLVRAELLKIWTTNSWWIFAIISLAATGLALVVNTAQAHLELQPPRTDDFYPPPEQGGPAPEEIERIRQEALAAYDVPAILIRSAANIFTSGQYFGLLFIAVLGVLVVTNEFFHQTATSTFLATPHRSRVIVAKVVAVSILAAGFWAMTTVINLGAGWAFFSAQGYDVPLAEWAVQRAILMNLLAYAVWGVLGVGLGVLIRSQLGATITAVLFYMLSTYLALAVFALIRHYVIKDDWIWQGMVFVPGVASQVMISAERLTIVGNTLMPPWWVGGLVLIGYGTVAAVIGTLIMRRRDIS